MEFSEIQERLNKLDTEKLIEVVKNYRQYGYTAEVRNYALSLLEKQGIDRSDLQLTGNFENKAFNLASDSYDAYNKNSKIAFVPSLHSKKDNLILLIILFHNSFF